MNLAALINEMKGDRSYERLARDCGGRPTAGRLQQIATSDLSAFPDPETIANLATGLRVSQRTVILAAAESLGLSAGESRSKLMEWLPADRLDELNGEQVRAILAVVHAMLPGSGARGARTGTTRSDPYREPSKSANSRRRRGDQESDPV